ncbi:MAG: SPOR domain-containing protein [Deltaproteobacteria bacterium]|nr:SPOR domain-containing protein [Deltaproteobacteria bacterium]
MTEYLPDGSEDQPPAPAPVDEPVSYFCQLTFGQFFTLVVLLVITLCFTFYVGARYGNQYLRIGEEGPPSVAVTPAMQAPQATAPLPESVAEDARLKELAREALMREQRNKLEGQVQEMLTASTPPRPTASAPAEEVVAGAAPTEESAPMWAPQANTALPREVAEGAAAMTGGESGVYSDAEGEQGPVRIKSSGGMAYAVQVGAYQEQREAAYFVEEWKAKGYPAYLMTADLGDRGRWYRVRLGGFATREDAEHYLVELKSKETVNGIVVVNEQ